MTQGPVPGIPGEGGQLPNLVGPSGRALRPGIAILKVPKEMMRIAPQGLNVISQVTGCNVIVLPLEFELLLGKYAKEELQVVHEAIHKVMAWKDEEKKQEGE